jgi:enterobacterial common antigen flippase
MSTENSYAQTLKSSSIMAGSSGFVMLFGLIRTKFAAILIGSTGIGFLASFTSIQILVSTLSGFGLSSSAVREISVAVGKDDHQVVGSAVLTLRRLSLLTGLLAMSLLLMLSSSISVLIFSTVDYAPDIALLSVGVLINNLVTAELAVLQGLRRVGDLARANVYSSIGGTLLAILLYFSMDLRGIVPALVTALCIQLGFARYYVKKIGIILVKQTWIDSFKHGQKMIGLGFTLMWATLLASGLNFFTIFLINRYASIEASGMYSAAFSLSGAIVGFVISAMGVDYYPRLTALNQKKEAMRELVNEQIEIGMLLAVPGLLIGIYFAPWLVSGLYSKEFLPAVPLLYWFILGCLGKVVAFPMSIVMLSMGNARWYFITETCFNLLHGAMIVLGLWLFGIEGVAIAFCLLYAGYVLGVYFVSKRLIDFALSSDSVNILIWSIMMLVLSVIISRYASLSLATAVGSFIVLGNGFVFLQMLIKRTGRSNLVVKKLLTIPGMKRVIRV